MLDADALGEVWSTLTRHKLRTALTAFSVAWGVFMLIILLGAGRGLENGATDGQVRHAAEKWALIGPR